MLVNVCLYVFSVCLIVSAQYLLNCPTIFCQIWYRGVLSSGICNAEKLVHHLQCQGNSEGLCNQNMTIFTISSKLLVHLQPNLD